MKLNRVNNPFPQSRSPQRNRDRSESNSIPHRKDRSASRETLCRVRPLTPIRVKAFQDQDLFEVVLLGPQQTYKRTTGKTKVRLNRVKIATENDAKEPKPKTKIYSLSTQIQ